MTESNFKIDFPKGQQGERFIAEYFQDTLGYKIISFNNTNTHDFIIEKNEKQFSVEVKTDTTVHLGGYVKTEN